MKKLYIASTIAGLLLAGTSCSETYDIYPEDSASVVMIKDAGAKELTVYSTETKVPVSVTIQKGGHSEGRDAVIELRAMDQAEFDEYRAEAGTPYTLLPSDCFSFTQEGQTTSTQIQMSADETYKIVEVYINASAFGQYMENYDASLYRPVLPIVLQSSDATVNTDSYETFILPSYVEPGLEFKQNGLRSYDLTNGKMTATVTLPIENKWDITFTVGVDKDLLDKYNRENETDYTLIPESAYSGLQTSYSMPAGTSSVEISLNIDPSKMDLNDALPLKITSCSVSGIEPDEQTGWFIADASVPLTVDMFSTNALEPSEGSLANLLDNDLSTYFHTAWSVSVSGSHWIQVTTPDKYSKIQISYSNRVSATTNALAFFNFYTGTSNNDLTMVKKYVWDADGLNGASGGWTTLAPMSLPTPQNVFRIENTGSWNGNVFFVMTEFRMKAI